MKKEGKLYISKDLKDINQLVDFVYILIQTNQI